MSQRRTAAACRAITILSVLVTVGCGSSAPTAPAPVPSPTPTLTPTPPPIVSLITVSACPAAVSGMDLGFYQQIGCNAFDLPLQPVRRWNVAPKVYLRTVDEAGVPIDAVTLDTVQNAMIDVAPTFTAGKFGLEGVLRGSDTREGVSGWITVKWPASAAAAPACGRSQVGIDGGWIELNYKVTTCACNASAIRPRTARHELGHALGYWHTDNAGDLMAGVQVSGCDASPSARELSAASFQYR